MIRAASWFAVLAMVVVSTSHAILPSRHGGGLPPGYFQAISQDQRAFELTRGWISKTARIGEARASFLRQNAAAPPSGAFAVAGTFRLPVLLGKFANRAADYPGADLENQLFDAWPTGTLNDYYNEVSYSALTIDGAVADWFTVSQADGYYEGGSNGLTPGDARTGEFIKELLDANDGAMDFGQYDNDGPDGIPNSGDDDGFVDLLVVVHNEDGGECGVGNNIHSHVNDYRLWPVAGGNPYTTGDAAMGGGFIKVQDYSILPGFSCGSGMIEIGGFAHAVGRGLGLPPLFDTSGDTNGIGYWGIMGHGCWNTPASPAHPSAWSRQQLGWVVPTPIGSAQLSSIDDIESNAVAFKLPFSNDRFTRMSDCAISGSFSMRCGLNAVDAAARGWNSAGYGNNWDETLQRDFEILSTTPPQLSYEFQYDLEAAYDSAYVLVCHGNTETVVAAYNGIGSGAANIDLTTALAAVTPPDIFTIKFRVVTDGFGSDEDNNYDSSCGALVIDNISVTGGGIAYATGFESSVAGWQQSPDVNTASEYWLIENRQAIGFDANLPGTGLLIWHVDDDVLLSTMGNSGGPGGSGVRGLVLEEADGNFDLLQSPGNKGDAGDPYPGTSNNTVFDANSSPAAVNNTGQSTAIAVTGIGPSASPAVATLEGGDVSPTLNNATPSVINNDQTSVDIDASGTGIRAGATLHLAMAGQGDIVAQSTMWHDDTSVTGDFDVFNAQGGDWDVVVTNPDGKSFSLTAAVTLVEVVAAQLVFADIEVLASAVRINFQVYDREADERFELMRSPSATGPFLPTQIKVEHVADERFRFIDEAVEAGRTYHYEVAVIDGSGERRQLYRGSATLPARAAALEQNYPNPFNPVTTIAFYLPVAAPVTLEVFDVSGARVRTLVEGFASAGPHSELWDGRNDLGQSVGSGIYVYRLRAGKMTLSRKMLLMK